MAEERLDITNKIIIPGDGNLSSEETKKHIIKGLEDLTSEDMDIAATELNEIREKKLYVNMEIPEELENYRKAWREKIENIDDESIEKIIKAAEKIPVNVETDSDGSRLIEFKVWWKEWKILDPILNNHTNYKYRWTGSNNSITEVTRNEVKLWWMKWDNTDNWKNKKLAEYVKQKEREWLHIAKIEEIKDLLAKLWDEVGLDSKSDQIAMLMYLTGMDWYYRLSMWDYENSNSQASWRSRLNCCDNYRNFNYDHDVYVSASLCMIACQ